MYATLETPILLQLRLLLIPITPSHITPITLRSGLPIPLSLLECILSSIEILIAWVVDVHAIIETTIPLRVFLHVPRIMDRTSDFTLIWLQLQRTNLKERITTLIHL